MSAYTVWTKPTQKADTPMSCSLLADLQTYSRTTATWPSRPSSKEMEVEEDRRRELGQHTPSFLTPFRCWMRLSPAPSGLVGNQLLPIGCLLRLRIALIRRSKDFLGRDLGVVYKYTPS